MNKILGALFIFLILTVSAYGESEDVIDSILSRDLSKICSDYYDNAALIIPRMYDRGAIDSIYLVLDRWENKCGDVDEIGKLRFLLDVITKKPLSNENRAGLEELLIKYIGERKFETVHYGDWFFSSLRINTVKTGLDDFIKKLAVEAQKQTENDSYENLICIIYQNNDSLFYNELKSPRFAGTLVQEHYLSEVKKIKENYNKFRGHFSFWTGIWMPEGNDETLGSHPEIGGMVGFATDLLQFDVLLAYRFLASKNLYVMRNGLGALESTSEYQGWLMGIDLSKDIFKIGRYSFDLVGGGGYDCIIGITGDEDERKNINSYNINFGCHQKIFFDKYRTKYFGISLRYNIVDYYTHGGTDLSGNAITLSISYGAYPNHGFVRGLETIYYDD